VFVVVFNRQLYNFNKVRSESLAGCRINKRNLFIIKSILIRNKICFPTSYRFYFVQFLERRLINVTLASFVFELRSVLLSNMATNSPILWSHPISRYRFVFSDCLCISKSIIENPFLTTIVWSFCCQYNNIRYHSNRE